MATSKVQAVHGNGDWKSPTGAVLFKYQYEMEDGTSGLAFHNSNAPKFQAGDEVDYEVTGQYQDGTKKLKVRKPGGGNFGGGGYSGGGRQEDPKKLERIERSWAIGHAVTMAGPISSMSKTAVKNHMVNVCRLAEIILQSRDTFPKFDPETITRAKWDSEMADPEKQPF